MPMRCPQHPGEIVLRQCLDPLGLTVERAAEGLGVTCQTLSQIVSGDADVSADMAIRLSKAFGSRPETWLRMQMAYNLRHIRERGDDVSVELFVARKRNLAD